MTISIEKIKVRDGRISRHPWVFNSALQKPDTPVKNGSIVDLINPGGTFLARGLYNAHARVGVRILSRNRKESIDANFFKARLADALALRHTVYPDSENANTGFRLVHGEADFLSGVVIDIYAGHAVVQFISAGMFYLRDELFAALRTILPIKQIYFYAEKHVQKQESFDCHEPDEGFVTEVEEYGLRFIIDPKVQHKTGFFLDQRENRRDLATLVQGKRVLDLCTFSGGFALAAKVNGKAEKVTAIDMDRDAIALAERNARLNKADINFVTANLHEWLKRDFSREELYDVVILDPAKLTKSREKVASALYQYTEMNKLAMRAVRPGGILLSCSCTGLVSEGDFLNTIRKAASLSSRDLQVFKVSGASADHPVLADAPETRYLKAIWCRVF